jgi:DNA polymerase
MRPELQVLWKEVDNCEDCKNSGNKLQHVLGGGKELNPKIMFIFINPTYRNITSRPDYSGRRFPFVGTKEIWKTFVAAKLLDEQILSETNNAEFVINVIAEKEFYFTNVVKCTKEDAILPEISIINKKIELLLKEINIVQPKLIVAFGILPFKLLTGKKLKLSKYYKNR